MTGHPQVASRRRSVRASARTLAAALALAIAAPGCVSHHAAGWVDEEPVYISVTNHNSLDMDIYAVHAGMRFRLGMVTTSSTGHFKTKSGQLGGMGEFQLYAHPIGSRSGLFSDMLHVSPGDLVEWSLEAVLAQSTLVIRDST